ncbi:MAG: 50S ribosomal protein L31 [Rickettsiales bacterium]|jgi:large subunit ribosomal protein L31|nr:50S ribosomal protein L31 [Rickettsiales bacterium]
MKQGIHPEYGEITITNSKGEKIKMFSAVKKDLTLAVDNLNHPAWTGQKIAQDRGKRAEDFKKKFDGFKF